jgi:hypothetical protein
LPLQVWAHDVRVLRISPVGGLQGDTWRPWDQQPIFDRDAQQGKPRRGDLIPGGRRGAVAGAGGARKLAPGGQHALYANA